MLNKIVLQGRLTADPERRTTPTGTAVASATLACDRDFKDKSTGEKGVDFIPIIAWRGQADFLSSYFKKGRMAIVEGRLQLRDWTDKEGNKRRSAEIVADNVYFGDKVNAEGREGGLGHSKKDEGSTYRATPAEQKQMENCFKELNDDGPLPF